MKRPFSVLIPNSRQAGFEPGDAAAHRAAAALADRADAPTIGALMDVLTLLERVGGQFHVTALRMQEEASEEYETVGFGFNYETRDARLKVSPSPGEVEGIPVSDMSAPAPEVGMLEVQFNGELDPVVDFDMTEAQAEAAAKLRAEHADAKSGSRERGPDGSMLFTLDSQSWTISVEGEVTERPSTDESAEPTE